MRKRGVAVLAVALAVSGCGTAAVAWPGRPGSGYDGAAVGAPGPADGVSDASVPRHPPAGARGRVLPGRRRARVRPAPVARRRARRHRARRRAGPGVTRRPSRRLAGRHLVPARRGHLRRGRPLRAPSVGAASFGAASVGPPPSGPPPSGPPPSGPPPSGPPPAACHPRTSGGHCYRPGGYCPPRDHGKKGVAGDGKKIICEDKKGWRWETY